MNSLRLGRLLLLAACAALLGAHALAAPARFAGVNWQDPAGMRLSTTYKGSCPGRCVTYAGGGASDDWPLIRVHEGVVGSAQGALNHLSAAYRAGGNVLRVLSSGEQQVGAVKVQLSVLEIKDHPEDSRPDYAALLLLEQGGVTLPLELDALDRDDLNGPRFRLLAALADSVKLSPEVLKKDLLARDAQFAALTKAVADGYARGEQAQVYDASEAGVRNEYGLGGLQLKAYRTTTTAAFLPGGVFLDQPGQPDNRAPDLRRMGQGEFPARWKRVAGGFEVTAPAGGVRLYATGRPDAGRSSLNLGQGTLWEIPRLSAADLAGLFKTISTASSGGGLAPDSVAVYSRSDAELELLPGGRYRSSGQSFTAVSSSNLAGSVGSDNAEQGGWSYDPASYTLTLRPEGGASRSGPTYTRTYTAAGRREQNVDWTLLGSEAWWKSR